MDPNELLKRLDSQVRNKEWDEAIYTARDLFDWISKDGFEPRWAAYPVAEAYYDENLQYLARW